MKHFTRTFLIPLALTALTTYVLYIWGRNPFEGVLMAIVAFLGASSMYFFFLNTKKEFPKPIIYPELKDSSHAETTKVSEPKRSEYQQEVLAALKSRRDLKKARYVGFLILLLTLIVVFLYSYAVLANGFHTTKKAIQGGSLLFSTGIAIIYYLFNREKFETFPSRIGFFSACAVGPPSVIEFLF